MTGIRGNVLVIGGGVAGPVAAMALRKAGLEATVYEAYPTPADGIGVTQTIAPNGIDALRIVGAAEVVQAIGLPLHRTVISDGYGVKLGEFPALPELPPPLGVWREDLCRAVCDQAKAQGIAIEYGKRLVDVEETSTGITARFADGSTATGSILVGADGIRSTVRRLIDPNAPSPNVMPLLNFGSVADYAAPSQPETMYFVFGKQAFFGYWVEPAGRTAWFANVPDPRLMTFAQANETPKAEWLRQLQVMFEDDVPARDVIKHTNADDLCPIGSLESMPKLPSWYRGRMVLVGDSAHGPSPSSGQGASMAIESAVQVARCLRDFSEPSRAFAAYEQLRRERVEKVIVRGVRTTNTKTVGPVGKTLMKLVMPLAMKTFLHPERTLGPEQRYHIDWDAPVEHELVREAPLKAA